MFEDLHMQQIFARPRTPNDNPFVESAFGTLKRSSQYPGRFLDLEDAVNYFDSYFPWYNTEHFHSRIGYITPEQCHHGLGAKILARRKRMFALWRQRRKEVNAATINRLTEGYLYDMLTLNQPGTGSVISP